MPVPMEIRTILVPVDGGPPSEAAVRYALSLAQEERTTLVFCHVQVPVPGYVLDEPLPTGMNVESPEALAWWSAHVLERAQARAAQLGLNARTCSVRANPVRGILDVARAQGVDLIIMGTHGRHGAARALLGSVTEEVLRRANVPVLILPPAAPPRSSGNVDAEDPGALA
ncbi:universal stress protein [bacterium]|nr:MAG: universal stress protein [bacterium]